MLFSISKLQVTGLYLFHFSVKQNVKYIKNTIITPFLVYSTGVLLYNFLSDAQKIIESEEEISQRVKFYSAHDVNVAGVSAAINVPPAYKNYATVIALELRKIVATDEVVVLVCNLYIDINNTFIRRYVGVYNHIIPPGGGGQEYLYLYPKLSIHVQQTANKEIEMLASNDDHHTVFTYILYYKVMVDFYMIE